MANKPKIGEIWVTALPIIYYEDNKELIVKIQRRPVLILDDGRGLIVEEDNRNYHVFKLTTQFDSYKRKLIKLERIRFETKVICENRNVTKNRRISIY